MLRTAQQNIELHTLLNKLGIDTDTKADMVFEYTDGRETSSAKLHRTEAEAMIYALRAQLKYKDVQADRKRKRVISHLREAGYTTDGLKADMPRIHAWVLQQKHKKPFNDHTLQELSTLITAADQVRLHFLSKVS